MHIESPFIKHISKILEPSILRPTWPNLPSFPFKRFSEALGEALALSDLSLELIQADWKQGAELTNGYGKNLAHFSFQLTPLSEPLFLIMHSDDKEKLAKWTLGVDLKQQPLIDASLEFIFSKALRLIDHLGIYSGLKPILNHHPLPHDDGYTIDLALHFKEETLPFRLICPKAFYEKFTAHYRSKPFTLSEFSSIENIVVPTPLELGFVNISAKEWKKVREGDWVILDQCTYHPLQKKGTLTLVLQNNPLFQLKIKEGQLKVLDYIFYQEGVSMTPENPGSDLDDSYQEEEISTENAPMQPLSIADEIPLSLRVEVGALNMSLKELVQIKPGSVIPLSTHPEREVKLTLNGKTVALGELIEMDETVGIKILQLP